MALNTRALLQKPYTDPVRMQKSLQKIGIPRSLRDRIVVGTKTLLAPGEVEARKQKVSELPVPNCTKIAEFQEKGSGVLDLNALPEAMPAARAMQNFYEELKAAGRVKKPAGYRKAEFLVRLSGDEEVLAIEAARNYVLSEEIISLASHYFEQVPILSRVDFWWSPENDTKSESQLYHYDGEDKSQLKLILNICDVDERTGPFTFIDAKSSAKIASSRRHSQRLDDEAVETIVGEDAAIQLLGPSGTVGAVDTSRCLHYGSRGNSKDRLILMIQFTRFLAPKASMPDWASGLEDGITQHLSPGHKMILGLS